MTNKKKGTGTIKLSTIEQADLYEILALDKVQKYFTLLTKYLDKST